MQDPEHLEKYTRQMEELYAAIGRFAVKFEHVSHAMQHAVADLLQLHGLKHGGLSNAVLSGQTADPMLAIFRAAIMEVRKDTMVGAEMAIFKNVISRIRKLIETRNDIIHRMWFVGWAAPTNDEFTSVMGWKHKNTGTGAEFRPLHFTREDFERHAGEAETLANIVHRIGGCLLLERPFAINFMIDDEGRVHLPPNS